MTATLLRVLLLFAVAAIVQALPLVTGIPRGIVDGVIIAIGLSGYACLIIRRRRPKAT